MGMGNIDFTAIVMILVFGGILMIPVLGLTLRWVLPTLVEEVTRARTRGASRGSEAGANGGLGSREPKVGSRRDDDAAPTELLAIRR